MVLPSICRPAQSGRVRRAGEDRLLAAGGHVHGRSGTRRYASALRPLLDQGHVRHGTVWIHGAVPDVAESGVDAGADPRPPAPRWRGCLERGRG